MKFLSNRLDRLEQVTAASSIYIRMWPDESAEQARARWLTEHPDRKAALEQGWGAGALRSAGVR